MSTTDVWSRLVRGIIENDLNAAREWDALAGGRPALVVGADGAVDVVGSLACLEWTRAATGTATLWPSGTTMAVPVLASARVKQSEPVKETSPLTGQPLVGLFDPSTGQDWSQVPETSRLMLRWARRRRSDILAGMSDREIFTAIQNSNDPMTLRIVAAWWALPESERALAQEASFVQGGRQTTVAAPARVSESSVPDVEAFWALRDAGVARVLREGMVQDLADSEELRLLVRDVAPGAVSRIVWQGSLEMSAFSAIDHFVRSGSYSSLRALVQRWSERYPHGAGIASVLRFTS